jgi:D-glycero-D-manno-heptose 1,7-bisphosphate phosphatase
MDLLSNKRPVVFLDRDGTLNVEKGYIRNLEDLVLIEGAGKAVRALNAANIAAILVSNQSGAARQYYPLTHIEALHERLSFLLNKEGAHLDAIYYCPHHPDGKEPQLSYYCNCRKPLPGLVLQAFADHPDLDKAKSFVVGDKTNDWGLANKVGAKCVAVETGFGQSLVSTNEHVRFQIDCLAPSVVEGIDWILSQVRSNGGN